MGHYKCWKYSVLSYIVFLCVTGVADLLAISYILLRNHSLRFFIASSRFSLYLGYSCPLLLAAIVAVGWKALCGKNHKLLKTFSVLLGVLVSLEVAFSVWDFIEKENLGRTMTDVLTPAFPSPTVNTSSEWDVLQNKLKCCGIHEASDYTTNIPKSCSQATALGKTVYSNGCLYPLVEVLADDFNLASLVYICTALIQLPCVFLTWCFSNRINETPITTAVREKQSSRPESTATYVNIPNQPTLALRSKNAYS